MRGAFLVAVIAIMSLGTMFTGCTNRINNASETQAFQDAQIVMHYIAKTEKQDRANPGHFTLQAGAYQGGTAVISQGGMAFWVKDGAGYVVNDTARRAAPDLQQAPDHIQFDAAFKAAAAN